MLLAGVLLGAPAAAQTPRPPGPWVFDLRGATSGLPTNTSFFPGIPAETLVPSRGFGFDVGGHIYLVTIGPSRVGVGAGYSRVRGTAPGISERVGALAPQVSFNFGTTYGWSYLSAGPGRAWVRSTVDRDTGTATADSGGIAAVNFGGGARWFMSDHVGIGFDVRLYRLSGAPGATLIAASVGISLR